MEDVVRELGCLALGSRLKRIGERLQSQAQDLIDSADVDVPSAQFPVLAALDRLGPLSIGDLAQSLGVSQPGVTRMVGKLEAAGWLASRRSADDRRVSTIALTAAGRRVVARSKRDVWPMVEAAVADACAGQSTSLLAQLTALEDALAATPLKARVRRGSSAEREDASA
ncbi:MAG: MarR family transcriptional regulator [Maricaulaceae bacterium]|jgi:DNA-binding MarR family transcriptional regulator